MSCVKSLGLCLLFMLQILVGGYGQVKKIEKGLSKVHGRLQGYDYGKALSSLGKLEKKYPESKWKVDQLIDAGAIKALVALETGQAETCVNQLRDATNRLEQSVGVDPEKRVALEKSLLNTAVLSGFHSPVESLLGNAPLSDESLLYSFPDKVYLSLSKNHLLIDQGFIQPFQKKKQRLERVQTEIYNRLEDKDFIKSLSKEAQETLAECYVMAVYQVGLLQMHNGWLHEASGDMLNFEKQVKKAIPGDSPWLGRYYALLSELHRQTGENKLSRKYAEQAVKQLEKSLEDHHRELLYARLRAVRFLAEDDRERRSEEMEATLQKDSKYYGDFSGSQNLVPMYMASFLTSRHARKYRKSVEKALRLMEYLNEFPHLFRDNIEELLFLRDYFLETGQYEYAARADYKIMDALAQNMQKGAPVLLAYSVESAVIRFKYLYQVPGEPMLEDARKQELISMFGKDHPLYRKYLSLGSDFFAQYSRFKEAEAWRVEQLNLLRIKNGRQSAPYLQGLVSMIHLLMDQGKLQAAHDSVASYGVLFDETDVDDWSARVQHGYVNGRLSEMMGDYDGAEKIYRQAFRLVNRAERKSDLFLTLDPELKASVQIFSGEVKAAEKVLLESLERKQAAYGERGFPLAKTHQLLARLYLVSGNLPQAKTNAARAEFIVGETLGDQSLRALQVRELRADIDLSLADYELAYQKLRTVHRAYGEIFGPAHFKTARVAVRMLKAEVAVTGNVKGITDRLTVVSQQLRDQLGRTHPDCARALMLLGSLHLANGDTGLAAHAADTAKACFAAIDNRHPELIDVYRMQARIAYEKGLMPAAMEYLAEAEKLARTVFNASHPSVTAIQADQAMALLKDQPEEALDLFRGVMAQREAFLQNDFLFLTQRERQKFHATFQRELELYPYLMYRYSDQSNSVWRDLLHHRMVTKGILLRSKTDFEKDVRATGRLALIDQLAAWKDVRATYTQMLMRGEDNAGAKDRLEETLERAEKLENELIGEVYGGKSNRKSADARDVQKALEKNEMLIEIIRSAAETGKPIYLAMLVDRSGFRVIPFPESERLESGGYRYLQNALKLEAWDKYSYGEFWAPLQTAIPDDIQTIYFSPDGIFNLVNPEVLQSPDSTYLFEKYAFVRLTNPVDILGLKEEGQESITVRKALLLGNPQLYSESGVHQWDALPGAEEEVVNVSEKLETGGWEKMSLTGSVAREDSLKHADSPAILHLATHGFFLGNRGTVESAAVMRALSIRENPLVKSGLLLAEGGAAFDRLGADGNAEGILTSLEAQNLELYGCKLVVLSACETGLGSVQVGNGVYGLQKAFLDAGAEHVVMTLQKVDDRVTRSFMDSFYAHYLDSGNEEQALRTAKEDIRREHPHPKYWGPFVLIR